MKKLYLSILMMSWMLFFLNCKNNTSDMTKLDRIDRYHLVTRHNPGITTADKLSPFSIGNGEFAFTADFTGLQTFSEFYDDKSVPLGTQSQWGWHTFPNPDGFTLNQTFKIYDTYGRPVQYASETNSTAAKWLRANPHRIDLAQIGFQIQKDNGNAVQISEIKNIKQTLNLWEGILYSNFQIEDKKVMVETACHPDLDQIAVQINSNLIKENKLGIIFKFPYGSESWGKETANWNNSEKHFSTLVQESDNVVVIDRKLDSTKYEVKISWRGDATFKKLKDHHFLLIPSKGNMFTFVCLFSQKKSINSLPNANETYTFSKSYWKNFWESGGAIDLSESRDPRAQELERRIVLSQYLTAIQCSGSIPPQETGLTCNSWFGKFHLEMHWWHAVHFALWGRPDLMENSLSWYRKCLPAAREKAARQGYNGVRWPKMVGPDGRESPSGVGVFLIWQQPHPIYYGELLWRINQNQSFLEEYKEIVFETAEFMASFSQFDEKNKKYVLGPPLIPAQEIYKPEITRNPAFELSYWKYGLETAQKWRERLGLQRKKNWDDVLQHLSNLPEKNDYYQNAETALNTFENDFNRNDHPTVLGTYGMLPNDDVDPDKMRQTLKKVMETWNWNRTWGWDYPLTAMTAARVGEGEIAIEALLMNVQKNTYLNNGHNYQDDRLTLYLPGNGGLLAAVAMMAAGWDGAPDLPAPGFPKNGNWVVKWEGLNPLP